MREILGFGEGSDSNTIREAHQHEQKRYAAFEQAILAWEKRTGLEVERSHQVGDQITLPDGRKITVNTSSQWKNFSKFLGSHEAIQYREENAMRLANMLKEWEDLNMQEPDMQIMDPEDNPNTLKGT